MTIRKIVFDKIRRIGIEPTHFARGQCAIIRAEFIYAAVEVNGGRRLVANVIDCPRLIGGYYIGRCRSVGE